MAKLTGTPRWEAMAVCLKLCFDSTRFLLINDVVAVLIMAYFYILFE